MLANARNHLLKVFLFALLIGGLLLVNQQPNVSAASSASQLSDVELLETLTRAHNGDLRISAHAETGKIRFIGASPDNLIRQPSRLPANASSEVAARSFLDSYGRLFGLEAGSADLQILKQEEMENSRSFVRFQQTHQGIPVVGGELIVQMGSQRNVLSVSGEILPDIELDTTPQIDKQAAIEIARTKVAKDYDLDPNSLVVKAPELWVFNQSIMGGPGMQFNALVWRTEVTPNVLSPIREFVLIDAHLGAVALTFNQIHTVKDRETYDAENTETLPGTLRCNESNPTCAGGDSHEVAAHTFAGDSYDFFMNEHGRDSIDNAGMTLISTVHYNSGYVNAFWSGTQMVYGDGAAFPLADDVVGHELAHGVTNATSNLFYYYQSGAINESLSDVWGELIDLYQATSNDTGDTRWAMGEDATGLGAIRNMQDPTLFNHPDRIGSPNYYCVQTELSIGSGDNGGVHINSGVNNKAAYLMTDGGTFNGKTVTALGYAKVTDLYYETNTNLLTSASDYADFYDALIQASINLGFSAAEHQEVIDALDAVEMNQAPSVCPALEAPICPTGHTPFYAFWDNLENGGGNWTAANVTGSATLFWFVPQTSSTIGFAKPYATSGTGNIWGFAQGATVGTVSDSALAMTTSVTLPTNAYMHFNHSFGFETNSAGTTAYDGGILEYSTNSGASWSNASALFDTNGYNGTLYVGNPLGAISAFAADSRGYMSSRLDLSSLSGQSVRFRFRMATDATAYDYGWFIDDVGIYNCIDNNTIQKAYLPLAWK